MPGKMKFEYNKENDIVLATPIWHIKDEDDCEVWYNQWVNYLTQFERKMDVIMILDEFKVESGVASHWGEFRARINKDHIRYGYRVNPELTVSIYIKTSGVRYNAASAEAATVEDAIQAIKDARAASGN